jgi:hypothetical protein
MRFPGFLAARADGKRLPDFLFAPIDSGTAMEYFCGWQSPVAQLVERVAVNH